MKKLLDALREDDSHFNSIIDPNQSQFMYRDDSNLLIIKFRKGEEALTFRFYTGCLFHETNFSFQTETFRYKEMSEWAQRKIKDKQAILDNYNRVRRLFHDKSIGADHA